MRTFDQRLDVCRACPNYVEALGVGCCKLIRDPSMRVSSEVFERRLRAGAWPTQTDADQFSAPVCIQPGAEVRQ